MIRSSVECAPLKYCVITAATMMVCLYPGGERVEYATRQKTCVLPVYVRFDYNEKSDVHTDIQPDQAMCVALKIGKTNCTKTQCQKQRSPYKD